MVLTRTRLLVTSEALQPGQREYEQRQHAHSGEPPPEARGRAEADGEGHAEHQRRRDEIASTLATTCPTISAPPLTSIERNRSMTPVVRRISAA
jgi:hypothetical protein